MNFFFNELWSRLSIMLPRLFWLETAFEGLMNEYLDLKLSKKKSEKKKPIKLNDHWLWKDLYSLQQLPKAP